MATSQLRSNCPYRAALLSLHAGSRYQACTRGQGIKALALARRARAKVARPENKCSGPWMERAGRPDQPLICVGERRPGKLAVTGDLRPSGRQQAALALAAHALELGEGGGARQRAGHASLWPRGGAGAQPDVVRHLRGGAHVSSPHQAHFTAQTRAELPTGSPAQSRQRGQDQPTAAARLRIPMPSALNIMPACKPAADATNRRGRYYAQCARRFMQHAVRAVTIRSFQREGTEEGVRMRWVGGTGTVCGACISSDSKDAHRGQTIELDSLETTDRHGRALHSPLHAHEGAASLRLTFRDGPQQRSVVVIERLRKQPDRTE